MKLFADTSVLLAACASGTGASRELFRLAPDRDWDIQTTAYVLGEVAANLPSLPPSASEAWLRMRPRLKQVPTSGRSIYPLYLNQPKTVRFYSVPLLGPMFCSRWTARTLGD